jgi:hypothetical protein
MAYIHPNVMDNGLASLVTRITRFVLTKGVVYEYGSVPAAIVSEKSRFNLQIEGPENIAEGDLYGGGGRYVGVWVGSMTNSIGVTEQMDGWALLDDNAPGAVLASDVVANPGSMVLGVTYQVDEIRVSFPGAV